MDSGLLGQHLLGYFALVSKLADAGRQVSRHLLLGLQGPIVNPCRLLVYRIWVTNEFVKGLRSQGGPHDVNLRKSEQRNSLIE